VTDLLFSRSIAAANPEGSSWTHAGIPGLGVVGLAALGALYLIWQWRRAGVYLYVGIGLVIFPINLAIIGPLPSLLGLAGVALIVALVSRQWRDFA
jgi:hypothetical protein